MAVRSVNRPGWNLEMLVFLFAHRSEDKGCAGLQARRTSGKFRHGAKTRLPDAQLWPLKHASYFALQWSCMALQRCRCSMLYSNMYEMIGDIGS